MGLRLCVCVCVYTRYVLKINIHRRTYYTNRRLSKMIDTRNIHYIHIRLYTTLCVIELRAIYLYVHTIIAFVDTPSIVRAQHSSVDTQTLVIYQHLRIATPLRFDNL